MTLSILAKGCYAVSFMLSVTNTPIMLSVVMLSAVMLSVVAPYKVVDKIDSGRLLEGLVLKQASLQQS
jgi:hypothetical protein